MDATQFQSLALGFIAAMVVVIPAAGGVIVLALQTWHKIMEVAQATSSTQATVAAHDKTLNGELDSRIDTRAKAMIMQHLSDTSAAARALEAWYASGNAPGASGAPGLGGSGSVQGDASPGSSGAGGQ